MRLGLIILALVLVGLWRKNKPDYVPKSSAALSRECSGKQLCAIVYLAPWCPACEEMSPALIKMMSNSTKSTTQGLQIIIGGGRTSDENEDKARSMGPSAMVDNDNEMASALKISYYPTIYVVEASGKITLKDKDAINWARDQFFNDKN